MEQQGVKHWSQVHGGGAPVWRFHKRFLKDNRKSLASCETSAKNDENKQGIHNETTNDIFQRKLNGT